MAYIKEGFVGAVPFSDNRPNYYDNPKKYTHKWVGKEVVIDFGSDSNIHPRRQKVSIKSVEPDRIVFITRNNADIIVNDRDYDEWKNIKAQITTQLVEEVTNMSNKKRLTEAESYGWVVEDWDAQEAYEFACDAFGEEELNRQIVMAIGNEELASCLAYIFRMNDFREWEEYKNGEELDEGCSKKKSKKKINESTEKNTYYITFSADVDIAIEADSLSDALRIAHNMYDGREFTKDSKAYNIDALSYAYLSDVKGPAYEYNESLTNVSDTMKSGCFNRKKVNESVNGGWRGCPDIKLVSHGTQADPDLVTEIDGKECVFNYWDIENALWDMFCEDTGYDRDTDDVDTESEFDEYCQSYAVDYMGDCYFGGYFGDNCTDDFCSWRASDIK